MAVAEPLDRCQWCKSKKVRCVERTSGENPRNEKYEVWLCTDCDGRALRFAKVEQPES